MNEAANSMIAEQLVPRGIRDERVLRAFERVPRDLFVPPAMESQAYDDHPVPIGEGQTISQPYIVAWMTELLDLSGNEKVLEVGTGSGYQTALLAELSGSVYSVERIAQLSSRAQDVLAIQGYANIHFKIGDGSEGWKEHAPFDRAIVTAAAPGLPPPIFEQLREGGLMVAPLDTAMAQMMTVVRKIKGRPVIRELGSVAFVPLIGKYGSKNI